MSRTFLGGTNCAYQTLSCRKAGKNRALLFAGAMGWDAMLKEFVARIVLLIFVFGVTNEVAQSADQSEAAKKPLAADSKVPRP